MKINWAATARVAQQAGFRGVLLIRYSIVPPRMSTAPSDLALTITDVVQQIWPIPSFHVQEWHSGCTWSQSFCPYQRQSSLSSLDHQETKARRQINWPRLQLLVWLSWLQVRLLHFPFLLLNHIDLILTVNLQFSQVGGSERRCRSPPGKSKPSAPWTRKLRSWISGALRCMWEREMILRIRGLRRLISRQRSRECYDE